MDSTILFDTKCYHGYMCDWGFHYDTNSIEYFIVYVMPSMGPDTYMTDVTYVAASFAIFIKYKQYK